MSIPPAISLGTSASRMRPMGDSLASELLLISVELGGTGIAEITLLSNDLPLCGNVIQVTALFGCWA